MSFAGRFVAHLFATARNRDGQAPALERDAMLASGVVVPGSGPLAAAPDVMLEEAAPARRATREETIQAVLARKVLDGWSQNRNQTLHPLTLNFTVLSADKVELLLQVAAAALLADGMPDEFRLRRAQGALQSARATAEQAAGLSAALDAPMPLHRLLDLLGREGLSGHAYAVALSAADQREPANRAFARYIANRLRIPDEVAGSLARRYRS